MMHAFFARRGNVIHCQQQIIQRQAHQHKSKLLLNLLNHQSRRGYIFFEPPNTIKQALQNVIARLGKNNGSSRISGSDSMLQGKKIMVRMRNNSEEQMKAMIALMQRNKSFTFRNNGRHRSQRLLRVEKYISSLELGARSQSKKAGGLTKMYYEKGRVRFKQWKQNMKQMSLSNYHRRKKRYMSLHHKYQHKPRQHYRYIKSRLRKISLHEIDKFMKGKLPKSTAMLSSLRRISVQKQLNWINYTNRVVTLNEPFQKEWFTKHGYPLTSRDPVSGRFVNPWQSQSTNGWKSLVDFWKWKKTRLFGYDMKHSLKEKFKRHASRDESTKNLSDWEDNVMNQEACSIPEQLSPPSAHDKIKMTWVGHATMLVQQSGFTILTDPVFSVKASPVQSFEEIEFLGVPRFSPPSFTIDDIPPTGVDICLISHDHYDHLDYDSVLQLKEKQLVKYWVVPLGLKEWLISETGVDSDRIIELEWWQSVQFSNDGFEYFSTDNEIKPVGGISNAILDENSFSKSTDTVKALLDVDDKQAHQEDGHSGNIMRITCAPAQHWCARSAIDRNTRLWCSWAIHSRNSKSNNTLEGGLSFYFAGDTAYPSSFPLHRLIGEALGPFDLASIPIGAYAPRFFMHDSHCNPYESVKIHKDVGARKSVAIHHSTFPLANEPRDEPMFLLKQAIDAEKRKGERVDFVGTSLGTFIESSKF